MLNRLIRYGKNISIYFSASLIPMVVSLLTNPLIALNMSPEDYGITGYYGSFNSLLTPLITFYIVNYYNQRYFRVSDEERLKLKATLIRALIYFSFMITIIATVVLGIYIAHGSSSSQIPIYPYLFLTTLAIPLTGIYSLTLNECRLQRDSKKFFRISVLYGISGIGLSLLFIVVFKGGARGKLFSTFIVNLLFFIWCIWYNKDCLKIKSDKDVFLSTLKFCWPLTIAAMLNFFSHGYDKVLLEKFGNLSELGFYSVGAQFAGYLHVFATAIQSTFQPDIYENIAKKNARKTALFAAIIIACISVVVLAYYIASPWVVDLLTAGRYTASVKYSQIISLATITSTAYYISSQITIALGKPFVTLCNRIISSFLIIIMFNILINNGGFYGAAWGNVLANIILLVNNILLLTLSLKFKINGIKNFANR